MKRIICVILVISFLLAPTYAFAYDWHKAEKAIDDYVTSGEFDLMGARGEKLYFKLRDDYAHGNKLKILKFDIHMFAYSGKMALKGLSDNKHIYGGLASIWVLLRLKRYKEVVQFIGRLLGH